MKPARDTALAAIAMALAGAPALAQERAATVAMTDQLTFEPAQVTVPAGATVEWQNTSNLPHTATADPDRASDPAHVQLPPGAEPFDSGFVQPGESYRHTFEEPGTYRYFCIPHEAQGMLGTVVVE